MQEKLSPDMPGKAGLQSLGVLELTCGGVAKKENMDK